MAKKRTKAKKKKKKPIKKKVRLKRKSKPKTKKKSKSKPKTKKKSRSKPKSKKKPRSKAKKGKRSSKRKSKSAKPSLPWRIPLQGETFVGEVEDFFAHIGVIALTLKSGIRLGDKIHVRGHTTDLSEIVTSMQIEHQAVQAAIKGNAAGIKVNEKCRKGDYVYRVSS